MKKIPYFIFMAFVAFSCSPKLSPDSSWGGKNWVLQELKGVPVQTSNSDKDAHLVFSPSEKRYSGTGGCNRIAGTYTIGKDNALKFADGMGTLMECPDIAFEKLFLSTLQTVNRYEFLNNELHLKNGKDIVMKLK